ncbi:DUF4278 domain-containing protein [Pseudoruegeria sp. HB172150]|uniref:DUF4278 domain-containing protein n=1 Tax=Pseudoruegeria sp. HB172150 TaxID=2721164 RepID=UPI00155742BD|nr:hypothetical protein [Pseudoruegeria sp. HB172150]
MFDIKNFTDESLIPSADHMIDEQGANTPRQLRYRGYTYASAARAGRKAESGIPLRYRGILHAAQVTEPGMKRPQSLRYRGNAY